MSLITDSHYFKNTNKSKTYRHSGKLLLIADWDPTLEFVYETYSIFVYENETNNVVTEKERSNKPNQQIIQEYLDHYLNPKDRQTRLPKDIIACNPQEYPQEKIVLQEI